MLNEQSKNELNLTTAWFKQAYTAIYAAGGNPSLILNQFSDELLHTLVVNNIQLVHTKKET